MRPRHHAAQSALRPWAWLRVVALVSMTLAAAPAAWGTVEIIGPVLIDRNSYTGDSSHGVTDFEDAIAGQTLTLVPFTLTSAGELIVLDDSCPGCDQRTVLSNTFSDEVLFRSPDYTEEDFPGRGAHPDQVNLTGKLYEDGSDEILRYPDDYVINPLEVPSDRLELDFVNAAGSVMAVGLGLWANSSRTITVYDAADDVVAIYNHVGDAEFYFVGFVATTPEDSIGRLEIDGSETFVSDVAFVPEPAAGVASAVALFAVLGLTKAHRRRPRSDDPACDPGAKVTA